MIGEGVFIQHMLYLLSQTVERLTHIDNAGNQSDARVPDGSKIIIPSRPVYGLTP